MQASDTCIPLQACERMAGVTCVPHFMPLLNIFRVQERRREVSKRYGNLTKETRKHGQLAKMAAKLSGMDQPIDVRYTRRSERRRENE